MGNLFALGARGDGPESFGFCNRLGGGRPVRSARARRLDLSAILRAVVNPDARREDRSLHAARGTQPHPVAGSQISLHRSLDDNLAGLNVGLYVAMGANRHAGLSQTNLTLRVAVNVQIGIAGEFSADFES